VTLCHFCEAVPATALDGLCDECRPQAAVAVVGRIESDGRLVLFGTVEWERKPTRTVVA
jgi:hypothetical protein